MMRCRRRARWRQRFVRMLRALALAQPPPMLVEMAPEDHRRAPWPSSRRAAPAAEQCSQRPGRLLRGGLGQDRVAKVGQNAVDRRAGCSTTSPIIMTEYNNTELRALAKSWTTR